VLAGVREAGRAAAPSKAVHLPAQVNISRARKILRRQVKT
jgi:hypothetical protein